MLRASTLGDVRLMFPLIATLLELRQAKMVLADVMEDLDEEGIAVQSQRAGGHDGRGARGRDDDRPFCRRGRFSQHRHERSDSIHVGRRPQQQGRGRPVQPRDPAVLRLIQMAITAADRKSVPVNVCGQMSANSTFTMLLLGMGLRRFSVTPSSIPEIKQVCRTVTIDQCRHVAERAMAMETARNITNYLREELKKILPELVA